MRAIIRRHGGKALIIAAVIAAMAALPSLAQVSSQLDRGRSRQAAPDPANRYVFRAGVLQRDHLARWVLSDGTLLRTDDATVWIDEAAGNAQSIPVEGRTVRIMGQLEAGGLLVRHGSLRDQGEVSEVGTPPSIAVPDTPEPVRPK